MERFHIIPNFLSADECSTILTKYKAELELSAGQIVKIGISNKRKSSIAFIPTIDIIDDKLKSKLKSLIQIKGYEVTGLGPYQFTEYKVGDYYDWHTDSDDNEYKDRFCSIVIQLNDTYEDGYLQLRYEKNNNTIQLDKGIGTMYVFFSNIFHRVIPVTNGVRYSLVNWISLKKVDEYKKTLI